MRRAKHTFEYEYTVIHVRYIYIIANLFHSHQSSLSSLLAAQRSRRVRPLHSTCRLCRIFSCFIFLYTRPSRPLAPFLFSYIYQFRCVPFRSSSLFAVSLADGHPSTCLVASEYIRSFKLGESFTFCAAKTVNSPLYSRTQPAIAHGQIVHESFKVLKQHIQFHCNSITKSKPPLLVMCCASFSFWLVSLLIFFVLLLFHNSQ